jgi:dephospho-CoA kinase
MKIIAFTGMPFSGKTEAVKIANEMGFPIIRMGDIVWDEVKKRGLKLNNSNVGVIANQMRENHGKNIWAIKTIKKIKSMKNIDFLIIDGIRNIEEIKTFRRRLLVKIIIIAIKTSDEIRIKRALTRNRRDDSKDIEKIKERDKREVVWGLNKVIESADILIVNNEGIEDFRKKIKKVLSRLQKTIT